MLATPTTFTKPSPRRKRYYRDIHNHLKALNVTNEDEQRNIYISVAGFRSLKDMSLEQLHDLQAFLANERPEVKAERARRTNYTQEQLEDLLGY